MTRWSGTVALAGRPFSLFVRPDTASWLADAQLPPLTLLVGVVLTAIAAWVAGSVVRRKHAVGVLRSENRDLDLAIERQRKIEAELRAAQAAVPRDAAGLARRDRGTAPRRRRVGDLEPGRVPWLPGRGSARARRTASARTRRPSRRRPGRVRESPVAARRPDLREHAPYAGRRRPGAVRAAALLAAQRDRRRPRNVARSPQRRQ